MRQDLARINIGDHSELVETFVRALNRVFADAPSGDLDGFVERGLADALNVSVPILAGHCEVAKTHRGADRALGRALREPRPDL